GGVEHDVGLVPKGIAQGFDQLYIVAQPLFTIGRPAPHEPFLAIETLGLEGLGMRAYRTRVLRIADGAYIGLDHRPLGAAEQAIDGGVEILAPQVPERIVDGADPHQEDARAAVAIAAIHLVPQDAARKRVLPDQ